MWCFWEFDFLLDSLWAAWKSRLILLLTSPYRGLPWRKEFLEEVSFNFFFLLGTELLGFWLPLDLADSDGEIVIELAEDWDFVDLTDF